MYHSIIPVLSYLRDPRYRHLLTALCSTGVVSFALLWWSTKKHLYANVSLIEKLKAIFSPLFRTNQNLPKSEEKESRPKVGVNSRFYSQLLKLAPILIPKWNCREVILLISLTAILISRTWLDIWFSAFNGIVVRSVVSKNKPLFISKAIVLFGFMMWPMSIINNSLKRNINSLALSFRTRLTNYAHERYFDDMVYYKLSNLDGRIQNPDQLLTQDIDKFSENLSHLYSDIAKPLVDIFLFTYKLGQGLGRDDIAEEQKLQGEFRYSHSRIIAHSEEIAFYSGQHKEKEYADSVYRKILRHIRKEFNLRFLNGIIDSVFVKYLATMLAYVLLSRPVFSSLNNAESSQDPTLIMEQYSRNSSYMVNLSQAIGRLLLAGRDLTKFAGYTFRISELLETLDDVSKGNYQRNNLESITTTTTTSSTERQFFDLFKRGIIYEQDGIIEFNEVPIVTPNGDVLVPSLSFRIEKGMNCIITGPNGCGKSSLFRILGNLWPLYGGILIKPPHSGLFYVPQKPYLPLGSLREQIIYPDTVQEALEKGYDDARLYELLQKVHLEYLVDREILVGELSPKSALYQGWSTIQDWSDVLSGGEKQRIAMLRLFYHRPQFAILDECTSAVSVDVEGLMYEFAKELGITLFTVSHRPSLYQFHNYILKFDGVGGYEFKVLQANDPLLNGTRFPTKG